jgi:UDP-N-acetylglucosamine 2-epimerase (non-hydrolysing)/GDP/UDP-N,N'-diacetylbacillosamine 2-epimerase (hydrolysing)
VNIGSRQAGRLRAKNVIDAGYDTQEILRAIDQCLHDPAFRSQVRTCANPYGAGNAGKTIANVLATIPLGEQLIRKKMSDAMGSEMELTP